MTIRFLGAGKNGAGLTNQPQGLDVGFGGGGSGTQYADQFNNFDKFGSVAVTGPGNWVTVLDVTGKGYLLEAYAMVAPEIRITVDGVVYYWSYDTTDSSHWTGIVNIDSYKSNGSSCYKLVGSSFSQPIINGSYLSTALPLPTRTQYALTILGLPIFFNTSLKIEITTVYTSGISISYGYRGGYK